MFVLRHPRIVLGLSLVAALVVTTVTASQRHAAEMASAANGFLAGLTPEQREQAALPFEGDERLRWNFIPNEMFPRKGLMVKAMSEAQREQAHALLKTGLSQKGYLTASAIMDLENVLRAIEAAAAASAPAASSGTAAPAGPPAAGAPAATPPATTAPAAGTAPPAANAAAGAPAAPRQRFARDPLEYFVTIFGTPSAKGAWGWRLDGHHISLHFTIEDGEAVASSPTFFGTNPAQVMDGPKKGLRLLGAEEDAARALMLSLDDTQRATATIQATPPNEILTANNPVAEPLTPSGISAAAMTPAQRELLVKLLDVYASSMAEDIGADRMARARAAGIENISFAWAGDTQPGQKHYYRVQGPSFLIEYDNVQNNGNHVHCVWRDFKGDFGRDLLAEHHAAYAH
jgi:hypothetical protein